MYNCVDLQQYVPTTSSTVPTLEYKLLQYPLTLEAQAKNKLANCLTNEFRQDRRTIAITLLFYALLQFPTVGKGGGCHLA